jgi:hypothetical protein
MNKTHSFIKCFIFIAIAVLLSATASCTQPSRSLTVVTGKVVYGTLAMEGAELKIYRQENGSSFAKATEDKKWKVVEESRSGYHGSFRLHLAEGTYRIEANTTMRSGEDILHLSGVLVPLVVEGKRGRMDQAVIRLKKIQR